MQIAFEVNLDSASQAIHDWAVFCAKKYLAAEAELLDSIIEIDSNKTYLKFGHTHLSPYCVEYLGLSEDVAGMFVRIARKTYAVPEIKTAIDSGKISVTKAKTIASVITPENHETW